MFHQSLGPSKVTDPLISINVQAESISFNDYIVKDFPPLQCVAALQLATWDVESWSNTLADP